MISLRRLPISKRTWTESASAMLGTTSDEPPVMGLLYTPDAVVVICWAADGWESATGPLADVAPFEARIWCSQWDLRWVEDEPGSGLGRATVLAEEPCVGEGPWNQVPVEAAIDHEYLLWGMVGPAATTGVLAAKWSTLTSSRVSPVTVPMVVPAGSRVVLQAREYLGVVGAHGLCGVVAERLLGLAVYPTGGRAGVPENDDEGAAR